MILIEQNRTGYPSIDKPWMQYFITKNLDFDIPNISMYQLVKSENENRLDTTAMVYFNNEISYQKLIEEADIVASAFLNIGVKKGDIVSIISLNTPETVYMVYGLNKIGAVANFINPNDAVCEIEENLIETNSKALVILDKILTKIGSIKTTVPIICLSVGNSAKGIVKILAGDKKSNMITYRQFCKNANSDEVNFQDVDGSEVAVILYTSGSTGKPKGVMLTNYNMNALVIQNYHGGRNHQPGEVFLNFLPPFFSFCIGMVHQCFYRGMKEVILLLPEPKKIMKHMKKYRPERMIIGPVITQIITDYPWKDMTYLIDLSAGGGAIPLSMERSVNAALKSKNARTKCLVGYGMTELGSVVTVNLNDVYKEQSVGIPLPLNSLKVIDINTGDELPYNSEGELLVNSPSLMQGYFNEEKETYDAIVIDSAGNRWLHTGDLAKIDEDGFLYITGRLKRIYISMDADGIANKLFPQHMEEVLCEMPEIEACGVVVKEHEIRKNAPVVFVVVKSDKTENDIKKQVYKYVEDNLPSYYKPLDVYILKELPKLASQKIDYRKLEEMKKANRCC